MTNLEWLHSLEPKELTEWFESEHVEARTCNISEGKDQRKGWWICSECDTPFDMIGALAIMNKKKPMYCPGCGAKVVG